MVPRTMLRSRPPSGGGTRATRFAWVLTLGLPVSLTACDVSLENEQLGIMEDGQGRIHVLYRGWADLDELVTCVQLHQGTGALGGEDDRVIWAVASGTGERDVDLMIGYAEPPSSQEVLLTEPLRGEYTLLLENSLGEQITQGFSIEGSRPGAVDTGIGGLMSVDEYHDEASGACPGRD
jgi:hypothetical protein